MYYDSQIVIPKASSKSFNEREDIWEKDTDLS